jgi:hypothetical protein
VRAVMSKPLYETGLHALTGHPSTILNHTGADPQVGPRRRRDFRRSSTSASYGSRIWSVRAATKSGPLLPLFRSTGPQPLQQLPEPAHLLPVASPVEFPLRLQGRLVPPPGLGDECSEPRVGYCRPRCDGRRRTRPSLPRDVATAAQAPRSSLLGSCRVASPWGSGYLPQDPLQFFSRHPRP